MSDFGGLIYISNIGNGLETDLERRWNGHEKTLKGLIVQHFLNTPYIG